MYPVSWSLWQAWSPCSVTCGDGIRERSRECLTSIPTKLGCVGKQRELSPCSLEECCTTESASITPHHPKESQRTANNLVTVTGISLCLSIIFATILITLWRKLCRTQKCSTPMRCDSSLSPSFRKNSDEENICQERQQRDSFSEAEVLCSSPGELSDMPLNFRRSHNFAQDGGGSSINESFQSNAQKIIPPIFSYRLAQQQLKEMKKKGLTETTKVYHVSQNPLMDTVSTENQEAAAVNKFRIKSPFLEQAPSYPELPVNKSCSKMDFMLATEPIWSPSQSLIRRGAPRYLDNKREPSEGGYPRNSQFRRTASFHETRKTKPFRKRSMSTLTPTQTPLYHCRTRMWDCVPEEQHKPKSKGIDQNTIELELYRCAHVTSEEIMCGAQNPHKWEPPEVKPHPLGSRQPVSQMVHAADRPEQKKNRSSPFLNYRDTWGKEPARLAPKDCHPRGGALSPTQYRRSKCQSFPSDPKYSFYDNTTFGLTESGQQMMDMDLPGYFGSSEGEISTLSIENLVI
ncbi:hypothetical protein JD844_023673 [Phrynosoma platyrhinos]|uniref:Thrombospondin type-1 domain-containing protein 1 n=1 Tax=Phrynosoma platyrhinos TaxID=52577 RepID=A0ABQ7SWX0_PHRPL|nr:hypothetical protein JD844_023673 [Phrynosoma platyrhinos]